jgi:putative ABC transport system permease protein
MHLGQCFALRKRSNLKYYFCKPNKQYYKINNAIKTISLFVLIFESLILTLLGFILGLLFSRFGVMFVSSLMEESLNYSLDSFKILSEEYWLLLLSLLIGLISSLIPAIQVYRINISKILADE